MLFFLVGVRITYVDLGEGLEGEGGGDGAVHALQLDPVARLRSVGG